MKNLTLKLNQSIGRSHLVSCHENSTSERQRGSSIMLLALVQHDVSRGCNTLGYLGVATVSDASLLSD